MGDYGMEGKEMKLVLRNSSGAVLAEKKVGENQSPSDELFFLLLSKTWMLEAGDTIEVVEEEDR